MGVLKRILLESKEIKTLDKVLLHYNIDKDKRKQVLKIYNNSNNYHSRDIMIRKLIGKEDFKKFQYWLKSGYVD